MTDDVCGYEGTTTGEPCGHPAGSCPIPSHSDEGAGNPQGRPSKYTEERAQDAIDAAKRMKSKAGCARSAGVGQATLQRWLDEHEEFRRAFRRARAQGEEHLINAGLADPEVDSSMAKFLLSTSFDYVKTEKQEIEHSGEGGGPLTIRREVVDVNRDD